MLICLYSYMLIFLYAYILICLYSYMLIFLYIYITMRQNATRPAGLVKCKTLVVILPAPVQKLVQKLARKRCASAKASAKTCTLALRQIIQVEKLMRQVKIFKCEGTIARQYYIPGKDYASSKNFRKFGDFLTI